MPGRDRRVAELSGVQATTSHRSPVVKGRALDAVMSMFLPRTTTATSTTSLRSSGKRARLRAAISSTRRMTSSGGRPASSARARASSARATVRRASSSMSVAFQTSAPKRSAASNSGLSLSRGGYATWGFTSSSSASERRCAMSPGWTARTTPSRSTVAVTLNPRSSAARSAASSRCRRRSSCRSLRSVTLALDACAACSTEMTVSGARRPKRFS